MLSNTIDSLKLENAKFARDVEYLKETAIDDVVDDRLYTAEGAILNEYDRRVDLMEAAQYADRLSDDEDVMTESSEIDKIMNATDDLTFEEMTGMEVK